MGDSGKFGCAMKNVPNSMMRKTTVKVSKKTPMPKVKAVRANTMQGGNIADVDDINVGVLKGVKLRNIKTKSGTNRVQR